jgi:predicted nucleic-acid-binding protein
MKYFIDTNIFVRVAMDGGGKQQEECVRLLKKADQEKGVWATGSVVLAETIWVLSSFYGLEKKKAVKIIEGIINLGGLAIIDEYDNRLAVKKYAKLRVKYIDALVASGKEVLSGEMVVVSYDKDFDRLGVKRVEPSDLVG